MPGVDDSSPSPDPIDSAPIENAPAESARIESARIEPVESAPVESAPVDSAPIDSAPIESAPAQGSSEPKISAIDTGKRVDPATLTRDNRNTIRRPEPRPARRPEPEPAQQQQRGGRREPEIFHKPSSAPAKTDEGAAENAATLEGAPASDASTVEKPIVAEAPPRPRRDDHHRGGPPRGARGPGGDRGRGGGDRGRGGRGGDRGRPSGPREGPGDFSDMAPIVVKSDPASVGDFAAMLAETGPIDRVDVRIGDKVRARCVHIGSETVFFEISRTQEGHMPTSEFLDEDGEIRVAVGDKVDAFVTGLGDGILLSTKLGKDQIDVGMLEQARATGMPVTGTVTGVNKGGIEISLSGTARGFCPLGQIDVNFVDDPQALVGKSLEFVVKEVKENGRNILLSRRALVEKQRKEQAEKLLQTLAVGQQIKGSVVRLQPFGAFVDLGGLDGLIPLSELGWGHVKNPGEVLKVGDLVTVEVKKIDYDTIKAGLPRIGLSLKAAQPDPFVAHMEELMRGGTFTGTVKKLETYGAFVELFPGVQGLMHISEIADRRIAHPKDVLKVDEQVQVRVLDVDLAQRRVSLSMKEGGAPAGDDDHRTEGARQRPKPAAAAGRGTQVEGVVDRVEKFGLFVKLDPVDGRELGSAFLPGSESGTPRGTDLVRAFPLGTRMSLLVIDVDERGRLKVSKTAREQAEERALVDEYKTDKKGAGGGLGTFGDLLKAKLKK